MREQTQKTTRDETAGIVPFVASIQTKKGMDNRNILIIVRCPCHVVNGLTKDLITLNVNARRSDQRRRLHTHTATLFSTKPADSRQTGPDFP